MGTEYFAVNKTHKVCYELGKGSWYNLTCDNLSLVNVKQCLYQCGMTDDEFDDYANEILEKLKQLPQPFKVEEYMYDFEDEWGVYQMIGSRYRNYPKSDFPMLYCTFHYDYN